MADVRAIHVVGNALVTRLGQTFAGSAWPGNDKPECKFQLVGSAELVDKPTFVKGVVFFLYRVQQSQHAGQSPGSRGSHDIRPPLVLDLHFLMFPWGGNSKEESYLLAWTMRELANRPVLGPGDLVGGGFADDEAVHVTLGELSNEDLMRIWDAIDPPYRISVPYIARVVQLGLDAPPTGAPVVVRKLQFEPFDGKAKQP